MAVGVEPTRSICNLVARGFWCEKKEEKSHAHELAYQSTPIAWGLCPLATRGLLPMYLRSGS